MTEVINWETVLASFPGEYIDHDSKEFCAGLLRGQLLMSRCATCGYWRHPPLPVCSKCLSEDVEPTLVSGKGVVYTAVGISHGEIGGTPIPCRVVATVELAEGEALRISAPLFDVEPEEVRIGMPVKLGWYLDHRGNQAPGFWLDSAGGVAVAGSPP
jgi:uncharacterized protein